MPSPLKVVFMGNHTVGVRTLRIIQRSTDLCAVIAHPEDPEDGVAYESVFDEATRLSIPVIRSTGSSDQLALFLNNYAPDIIWITDYRYLLPSRILEKSKFGVINLHPSLLPRYRGRAPVNWAILNGESTLGLTAHFVDEGMDTGDIIAQQSFELEQKQDVANALSILYPIYESITAEVLSYLEHGDVPRRIQDSSMATTFPRRKPEDGRLNWNTPARDVWNLIRAVAKPYPGAFTHANNTTIKIWQAIGLQPLEASPQEPGSIINYCPTTKNLTVACQDFGLVLSEYELENSSNIIPPIGTVLQ